MTIAATVMWLRQQPWQLFWNIEMFSLSGCIAALTLYEANYTRAPSSEPQHALFVKFNLRPISGDLISLTFSGPCLPADEIT